jgi:hypothetical protein
MAGPFGNSLALSQLFCNDTKRPCLAEQAFAESLFSELNGKVNLLWRSLSDFWYSPRAKLGRRSQDVDRIAIIYLIPSSFRAEPMIRKLICSVSLLILAGCTDGVLYQMKRINPYYRAEWKRDEEIGVTFSQRMEEMKLLRGQMSTMPPEDQVAWAARLEHLVIHDSSPEIRAQALQTIAMVPGESTVRALNAASTDESEKVRLMACRAWKEVGGSEAKDMLLTLANNASETTSVRQAAIKSLSGFDDSEVRTFLSEALNDRSPAIQYEATRSLAQVTGRDFGGDFQAWRDYMEGKDVAEPRTSMASALLESVKFWQ